MKRNISSQPSLLTFFNKKITITEFDKNTDISYSSNIINNTKAEINTDILISLN